MPVLLSSLQLVVRLQPDEAIYLKMIVKRPGVVAKGQEGRWGGAGGAVQQSDNHMLCRPSRAKLQQSTGSECLQLGSRSTPFRPQLAGLETGDTAISELDLDYGKRYPVRCLAGMCAAVCLELRSMLHRARCHAACRRRQSVRLLASVNNARVLTAYSVDYQQGVVIPDAYPRLILDAIRGDQQHFVRRWAAMQAASC